MWHQSEQTGQKDSKWRQEMKQYGDNCWTKWNFIFAFISPPHHLLSSRQSIHPFFCFNVTELIILYETDMGLTLSCAGVHSCLIIEFGAMMVVLTEQVFATYLFIFGHSIVECLAWQQCCYYYCSRYSRIEVNKWNKMKSWFLILRNNSQAVVLLHRLIANSINQHYRETTAGCNKNTRAITSWSRHHSYERQQDDEIELVWLRWSTDTALLNWI